MAEYTVIDKCRVCGGSLKEIISLGEQASVGFTDTPQDGVKVPLELVLCKECFLLQLRHTTDPSILYNNQYGYKSGVNDTMKAELKSIVESVNVREGDLVIDIGCNDGTLLSNYPRGVYRVGFDPSMGLEGNNLYNDANTILASNGPEYALCIDYFNAEAYKAAFGPVKAKVITAIAMFYDLEDPNKFLQDVKEILDDEGVFIIQQNYLVGMLEQLAYDNICHEHLEYYSLLSLENLLKKNGLAVWKVEEQAINGGSFRTYIKKDKTFKVDHSVLKMRVKEEKLGLDTPKPYLKFAKNVKKNADDLRTLVKVFKDMGKKVYVYGASTRGNSLLQVAGIDHTLIEGAAERNPVKYGKYTVATKIPIVSEEEARQKADIFLVLPWFFKGEFTMREDDFIKKGGTLVFPLPEILYVG